MSAMTERDFADTAARYGKNSIRVNAHTTYSVGHKYRTPGIAGYGVQDGVREIARDLNLEQANELANRFGQSMEADQIEITGFDLDVQTFDAHSPTGEHLTPLYQHLLSLPTGAQVSYKLAPPGERKANDRKVPIPRLVQTWHTPKAIALEDRSKPVERSTMAQINTAIHALKPGAGEQAVREAAMLVAFGRGGSEFERLLAERIGTAANWNVLAVCEFIAESHVTLESGALELLAARLIIGGIVQHGEAVLTAPNPDPDPASRLVAAQARVKSHINADTTSHSIKDIMAKEFGDGPWPEQTHIAGVCDAIAEAWGGNTKEVTRLLDAYRYGRREEIIQRLSKDSDLPDILRACGHLLEMRPSDAYIRKHIHAIADRTRSSPETVDKCFSAITAATDAKTQAENENLAARKAIEIVSLITGDTPLAEVREKVIVLGTIEHVSRRTLDTLVGILSTTTSFHLSELSAWAFSNKRWSA